jgi:peptidoglycan/LPS O-acetylase OafA/YrhL
VTSHSRETPPTVPPPLQQEQQVGDLLDVAAGLVTAALVAMVYAGGQGAARILLTLGFTLFAPGRAIVANWPRTARWSEVAMPLVLSLAVLTLLAATSLWAHAWHPLGLFQAEAWLTLTGLSIAIARRHRHRPGAAGRPRSGP